MANNIGLASLGREGYPRIDIDLDDISAVFTWLCYLSPDAVRTLLTRLHLRADDTADGGRWRLLRYHVKSRSCKVTWVPEDDEWPAPVTPEPLCSCYHQERPRDIYNAVRKWGVKFSGRENARAVEFLQRVEEYRVASRLSHRDVLAALPFLLTDIALVWQRLERTQWHTWTDFADAFRDRFCDPVSEIRLREEARRRTQGPDEPIADYLVCLRAICNSITKPLSEIDQLNLAYTNLHPKYRSAISHAKIDSFKALVAAGRRIEKAEALDLQYLARSRERTNPPEINWG